MNPSLPNSLPATRGRLAGYAVAIFLSSAALMALEIAAARLLAPYIGASLYSWTAIIGVVLGGLSLGNWLGGVWADRGGAEAAAGWTLGAGGLACIGVLLLLTLIAGPLQRSELGLMTVSFLFVAGLFFLPAVLLGVVTPILTTLALRLDQRTGHVVGMMHALAAFGSIVGTFATGYLFIQYFGTRAVIIGTAAVLGLLAVWFLRRARAALIVMTLGAIVLATWTGQRGGFVKLCDEETSYFCIRVVNMNYEAPFGEARGLVLDHLLHGISHRERPTMLIAPYTHLMNELMVAHSHQVSDGPLHVFFAGGGSYTQPRALRQRFPDAEIVVSELDPSVTEVARHQLYYEPRGDRIVHSDARWVLARMPEGYFDIVVGDVFHDVAIPYHLITLEYAHLVRSRLRQDGLYLLNVVDAHPDPRLVKSVVKTLREVLPHVQVWLDQWPDWSERMTYVISAGGSGTHMGRVTALQELPREWLEVSHLLAANGTAFGDLPVLTDDLAPVERLLSPLMFGTMAR